MRITVLSGSVPTTTFIDALVNTMAEEGYSMTVIGKQTGAYHYHEKVKIIIVPDDSMGRLFFIVRIMIAIGFRHVGKIWKQHKDLKQFYNDLLFYLPIIHSRPERIHFQWAAFVHDKDLLFDLYPGKILVSMRGAHINYTPITTPSIKESYKRLFPRVHRFHAVSEAIRQEAKQYGANGDITDVIYSFVKDEVLNKEIKQKSSSDTLKIISVGRFFWKKGYEYALDALFILKEQGVKFSYTLIAEGVTPANIVFQLHQLELTNYVMIINGLTHEDVLRRIEEHDVLLLPSVEEGVANVVLEAMAVGTPVITTDVGGMKEIIDNGETGYVVRTRDVQAMSSVLIDFDKLNMQERLALAQRAKKSVQDRHDKATFAKAFSRFYNN